MTSPPVERPKPSPVVTSPPVERPKPSPVVTSPPVERPKPSPVVTSPPVERPKPSPVATTVITQPKQTLKIEALDKITIEYQIDNKPIQSVILDAEKSLTLESKNKILIKSPNAGALYLEHNGKKIGVPGNLGEPLEKSFP